MWSGYTVEFPGTLSLISDIIAEFPWAPVREEVPNDGVSLLPLSASTLAHGDSQLIHISHKIHNNNNISNHINIQDTIYDETGVKNDKCMSVNSHGGEGFPWSGNPGTDTFEAVGTGTSEIENIQNNHKPSIFDVPGDAFESIDLEIELSSPSDGGPWSRPPELDDTRWDNQQQNSKHINRLYNNSTNQSKYPIGASNYLQWSEGERDKEALNRRETETETETYIYIYWFQRAESKAKHIYIYIWDLLLH